jgi:hypothetical protein
MNIKKRAIEQINKLDNAIQFGNNIYSNFSQSVILKKGKVNIILNTFMFTFDEIDREDNAWKSYLDRVIYLLHKINTYVNKQTNLTEQLNVLIKFDSFTTSKLLTHFSKSDTKIVDTATFPGLNIYIISFKNIECFLNFVNSRIFFKTMAIEFNY